MSNLNLKILISYISLFVIYNFNLLYSTQLYYFLGIYF